MLYMTKIMKFMILKTYYLNNKNETIFNEKSFLKQYFLVFFIENLKLFSRSGNRYYLNMFLFIN